MGRRRPDDGARPGRPPAHCCSLLVIGPDLSATFALPDAGVVTLGRSRDCGSASTTVDLAAAPHHPDRRGVRMGTWPAPTAPLPRPAPGPRPAGAGSLGRSSTPAPSWSSCRSGPRRCAAGASGTTACSRRVEEECARAERAGAAFALLRISARPAWRRRRRVFRLRVGAADRRRRRYGRVNGRPSWSTPGGRRRG
jgi:hypothetical protein